MIKETFSPEETFAFGRWIGENALPGQVYTLVGDLGVGKTVFTQGVADGTGMGGPGYSIKGEFAQNGVQNDLRHTEGVLSMARAMHPDSAGSQFFIMHKNAPHLDGAYAAFGKVIEGMDVVNRIAETDTDYSDRPLDEQKIKSMTVETFGAEYPEPEKC